MSVKHEIVEATVEADITGVKFEIKPVSVAKATANFSVLSKSVKDRVAALELNKLEATVENISKIKDIRAELNNEKKTIESERKMVEAILFKDWLDFMAKYKLEIKGIYDDAEIILKEKVDSIDAIRLQNNIKYAEDFLSKCLETKPIPILNTVSDVKVDIKISTTESVIRKAILEHVDNVSGFIEFISTYPDEDDIKELFDLFLDTRSTERALTILNSRKSKIEIKDSVTKPKEVFTISKYKVTLDFELTESQMRSLKNLLVENGYDDFNEKITLIK